MVQQIIRWPNWKLMKIVLGNLGGGDAISPISWNGLAARASRSEEYTDCTFVEADEVRAFFER